MVDLDMAPEVDARGGGTPGATRIVARRYIPVARKPPSTGIVAPVT